MAQGKRGNGGTAPPKSECQLVIVCEAIFTVEVEVAVENLYHCSAHHLCVDNMGSQSYMWLFCTLFLPYSSMM